MTLSHEKVIGEQILKKIDQLIELIIAASLKPDDRQKILEQGDFVMSELITLLEQLLGPREDYLCAAVKELIAQRLPDQRMLEGFNDFYDLLEEIYRKVHPKDDSPRRQGRTGQMQKTAPTSNLERALRFLFPDLQIFKNHRFRGLNFEYYLPSLRLAVEDIAWEKSVNRVRKEFLCRKYGIQLLLLDSRKGGYRDLARVIKRRFSPEFLIS